MYCSKDALSPVCFKILPVIWTYLPLTLAASDAGLEVLFPVFTRPGKNCRRADAERHRGKGSLIKTRQWALIILFIRASTSKSPQKVNILNWLRTSRHTQQHNERHTQESVRQADMIRPEGQQESHKEHRRPQRLTHYHHILGLTPRDTGLLLLEHSHSISGCHSEGPMTQEKKLLQRPCRPGLGPGLN